MSDASGVWAFFWLPVSVRMFLMDCVYIYMANARLMRSSARLKSSRVFVETSLLHRCITAGQNKISLQCERGPYF